MKERILDFRCFSGGNEARLRKINTQESPGIIPAMQISRDAADLYAGTWQIDRMGAGFRETI